MGTKWDEIEDEAMVEIVDPKIHKLYENCLKDAGLGHMTLGELSATLGAGGAAGALRPFYTYMDGFLKRAVHRFPECAQPLTYDEYAREFDADLTEEEKNILVKAWELAWFRRETQNSAQLALKLKVSSAFTFSSEASHLKAQMNYLDTLEEELARQINHYVLQNYLAESG